MKVLITNDDGVYAEGIKILTNHLSDESLKTTVVAPLEERSTTGHTLSLDNPLRVVEIDKEKNIYGCSGFPADCTILGFGHVMESKPDLVISGINRGANLGQDVYYSGTVAGAREAVFHKIPGIAISLAFNWGTSETEKLYYDTAGEFLKNLIVKKGFLELFSPNMLLNINVPNLPMDKIKGVRLTHLGFRKYSEGITKRKDFRNRNYYWLGGLYQGFEGGPKSDCFTIEEGHISLTLLNLLGGFTEEESKWQEFIGKL